MRAGINFSEYDTKLSFSNYGMRGLPSARDARGFIQGMMREWGWHVETCPDTLKNYPCIAPNHDVGRKGDLHVYMDTSDYGFSLEFFQEINVENKNGGRYDFQKRERMPYLIGLQYEATVRKISALAGSLGMPVIRRCQARMRGADFIEKRQAELNAFQGKDHPKRALESYNCKNASGIPIIDGATVYFLNPYGPGKARWQRGIARYNINNTWWVLLPSGDVHNIPCFDLHYRAEIGMLKGRHISANEAVKKLTKLKQEAIQSENYERAAVLRDTINQRKIKP